MIDKKSLQDIMVTAMGAAKAAEKVLLKHWRRKESAGAAVSKFTSKADNSPVTRADREAETAIRQAIHSKHPGHRIVGEEFSDKESPESSFVWVVDPLDGTKQFVRGLACFGTLIAVVHRNRLIAAVSHAPALGETVTATKGGGSFMNGHRLQVSRVAKLKRCMISHGALTLFEDSGHMASLAGICRDAWGVQGFSDFWSYHLVASGRVDVILEAKAKVWDLAAVSLIVEEAGGRVTDLAGSPFTLDITSMVATNGFVHDEVLEYFMERDQHAGQ